MRAQGIAPPPAPTMPARRAFLAGLLAERSPHADEGRPGIPAERIALLKDIASRWERRLPQGAIPQFVASNACAGHGTCASVCPTGALRSYEISGFQGIEFDARNCFACGACVVVCPEQALGLEARGTGATPAGYEAVTRHALRVCARCDDEYPARGEDELCPACRKDMALFTSGFPARSDET